MLRISLVGPPLDVLSKNNVTVLAFVNNDHKDLSAQMFDLICVVFTH
jgi:hypothetical protein